MNKLYILFAFLGCILALVLHLPFAWISNGVIQTYSFEKIDICDFKIVEKNGIRAVIKKIGKLHRVIIASSNTEQEANVVKETYKKTFGETPYVLLQ